MSNSKNEDDIEIPDPDKIEEETAILRKKVQAINARNKIASWHSQAPAPAESSEPVPAETSPLQSDENAALLKAEGAQIPGLSMTRPQPPGKSTEQGSVIVAKALAEQLGTAPEMKGEQRIDERKMAVLSDTTLVALSHFSYRHVYDGVRYWGHLTEWYLTGSQGIGGLARRHILQALANTSGIQVMDKVNKPNAIARNLWDRDWREKAEKEGKVAEA